MSRERYPFKAEFEPVVDVGDVIHLMPIDRYYEVEFSEPIPYIRHDFGPINPGEIKVDQELTFLYMPRDELAQWRMVPCVAGLEIIAFKQPRNPKWITRDLSGILPRADVFAPPEGRLLNLTEWYQFEDTKAYISIRNAGTSAISQSLIEFYGFRFHLRHIEARPEIRVPTIWYEARAP